MTNKTVPRGHKLEEKEINLHNRNPLFSSKTGWGLGPAVEMGSRSLSAQRSVRSAGLSAGRRGCCRSSVDALGTICICSCSTARSDGGFDAGVRKQTSRGDEVADVQWQLATARWEAQWSRESAQVSWERNAKYPRLAKGMGSLPPWGKGRARGDFPQLRPPVCLIQTQHAQQHRGN